MSEQKATNITWHEAEITQEAREKMLNQKGVVLWFTGLSGSGKSTLAHAVERKVYERGHLTYVLDGDNIRHGYNKNLGFSPEDREENIRRIGEGAKLFTHAGVIAKTAFISPYRADRDKAHSLIDEGWFVEIFCQCSLDECEKRDPKGLYKKARAGEIKQFTGIDAPYEAPENPEVNIETDKYDLDECASRVLSYLETKSIIS
jgi:adenylylsulfate kinase